MKDRKVKQVLWGDEYWWEWGGQMERVKEGKNGPYTLYICMKTEQ
jgi:hypothetical protein